MARQPCPILLDANGIIESVRIGAWDELAENCIVETVEEVLNEVSVAASAAAAALLKYFQGIKEPNSSQQRKKESIKPGLMVNPGLTDTVLPEKAKLTDISVGLPAAGSLLGADSEAVLESIINEWRTAVQKSLGKR